jgi:hypothetical protein
MLPRDLLAIMASIIYAGADEGVLPFQTVTTKVPPLQQAEASAELAVKAARMILAEAIQSINRNPNLETFGR